MLHSLIPFIFTVRFYSSKSRQFDSKWDLRLHPYMQRVAAKRQRRQEENDTQDEQQQQDTQDSRDQSTSRYSKTCRHFLRAGYTDAGKTLTVRLYLPDG